MKKLYSGIVAIVLLMFSSSAFAGDILVMDAVAAASPTPQTTNGAAYLSIMNKGKQADALLGFSTPSAGSAMLHESKDENGVMKMIMMDQLDIPAGATVDIRPGHLHIMLEGLKQPLKVGDLVLLDLQFQKAGHILVDAMVKNADDLAKMK